VTLAELLTPDHVIPFQSSGEDFAWASLAPMFGLAAGELAEVGEQIHARWDRVRQGEGGAALRTSDVSELLVLEGMREDGVWVAVSDSGFGAPAPALRVLLVLHRARKSRISEKAIEEVRHHLATPDLERDLMSGVETLRDDALRAVLKPTLDPSLRVADAYQPSAFRIYPDAPLDEILDLMVRKSVSALPVVGESLQVIGIVTAGDVLRAAMQRGGGAEVDARQIMSRAVLCVTEEQSLREAGRIMAQRDLAQLPVVRDGELIGFLSRESVLERLFTPAPRPASGGVS